MAKRQSTTKKLSKADSKAILNWLARNSPHGVIIRLRGEEIGVVGVDVDTMTATTDEGETVSLKDCTIPKSTVAWILQENTEKRMVA